MEFMATKRKFKNIVSIFCFELYYITFAKNFYTVNNIMKRFLLIITIICSAFATSFAAGGGKKGEFNAKDVILGHVQDSYDWHFFDVGETVVALPLPIILFGPDGLNVFMSSKFDHGHHEVDGYNLNTSTGKIERADGQQFYDFSITKNVFSMFIAIALLLIIMINVAKKYKKNGTNVAPSGFQNALEPVVTFIRDEVAKPNLGNKYMKYMPLLLTMFFFIWINNLIGLIPSGANFTGNIAVTAALALVSFVVIVFSGNKHFWGHLFNPPGVPFGVKLILVPIEVASLFIKPVALTIRLFANILAGHIIILSLISMIFIFGQMSPTAGWGFAPVSIAFTLFMFCLELLVAAIQAFIFTTLTAVFIGQVVEEHHESHDDSHAPA